MNNEKICILFLKKEDLFTINISNIMFIKSFEEAYQYSKFTQSVLQRNKIYSLEEAQKTGICWHTNENVTPITYCQIICIDSDTIWNVLQAYEPNDKSIVYNIYKTLKINKLLHI